MSDSIREDQVFDVVRGALYDAIRKALETGYNTPVNVMVTACIERHRKAIETQIDKIIVDALVLDNPEFQGQLREEFRRKVAKILISKCEGSVQQAVGDVMRDPVRRSRLIVAVEGVLNA